jgi:tryptophan synthase alpha chain
MIDPSRKTIIPFLMAGYPDLQTSEEIAGALIEEGVRVLEIGVPFSDPLADGPTIQKAASKALEQGTTLVDVFGLAARLKKKYPDVSIVLFTYLNPLLKYGLENYVKEAVRSGVNATLTVDLPPEEASQYLELHQAAGLKTVFLASPTTSLSRLKLISEVSTGFIYYISRTGVTGAQREVSNSLPSELLKVRELTQRPIAVGFGISTPEQAREVSQHCDAVVIGSHLLNFIERNVEVGKAKQEIRDFIRSCFQSLATSVKGEAQ